MLILNNREQKLSENIETDTKILYKDQNQN